MIQQDSGEGEGRGVMKDTEALEDRRRISKEKRNKYTAKKEE